MQRTHLSHGAWIDHLEGWLSDDLEVMDTLRDAVAWRQGSRTMYDRVVDVPRLTAWCSDPYAAAPFADQGLRGAQRALRTGAVHLGRPVLVSRRPRQRRLARGHDRCETR